MAPAAAPARSSAARLLSYLLTPDPSLNYGFLIIVYTCLSLLTLALAGAQYAYADAGVKGYWIITSPCVPGLLYLIFLRSQAGGTGWSEEGRGAAKKRH